jgi:hypothetical protein
MDKESESYTPGCFKSQTIRPCLDRYSVCTTTCPVKERCHGDHAENVKPTAMDLDAIVKRFDEISKSFDTGIMEPQLQICIRHGWKDPTARFYASFKNVWISLDDGFGGAAGSFGNGTTPEEAMLDYLKLIGGKTLIYNINTTREKRVTVHG